jgi:sugar phosphate isomerase/epimerase
MTTDETLSRRTLLKLIAAAGPVSALAKGKNIPIGLELFSVREELAKDPMVVLQDIAKMGYECVEFFAPYYDWTPEYAKQIRKQLDQVGLRCYSTHNDRTAFRDQGLRKAIELNKILGTRFIVMAHPGKVPNTVDGWKDIASLLDAANQTMASEGLHPGYHNHDVEWRPIDGQLPMEILANNTDKSIMLQLDVGTCVAAGHDPVSWIDSHPGRIKSLHLKDWSPGQGYKVLFGEGAVPWKQVFAAAETKGGVEYYLIEQEGSRFPEMETAERCLVAYRDLRHLST